MRLRIEEMTTHDLEKESKMNEKLQKHSERTDSFLCELHTKRSKTIEILATSS
jgi:hypothetical protein